MRHVAPTKTNLLKLRDELKFLQFAPAQGQHYLPALARLEMNPGKLFKRHERPRQI